MKTRVKFTVFLLSALGFVSAFGQEGQSTNPASNARSEADQANTRWMQHMEEMEAMAKSMASMADVCRTMMEKEMQHFPLKLAAIIALGTLLTIALVLFIVLELQWIKFWSVRIKTERLKLTAPRSS